MKKMATAQLRMSDLATSDIPVLPGIIPTTRTWAPGKHTILASQRTQRRNGVNSIDRYITIREGLAKWA
jgi:hypothetical protein